MLEMQKRLHSKREEGERATAWVGGLGGERAKKERERKKDTLIRQRGGGARNFGELKKGGQKEESPVGPVGAVGKRGLGNLCQKDV